MITVLTEKGKTMRLINADAYIWIPVKERLPESLFIKTLVSAQDKKTGLPLVPSIAVYDGFKKTWDIDNVEVIAWMPLPPSYKGE